MLSVSGCRGVVGDTLTPEVASRFAGSFGAVLRTSGARPVVAIGRDGRRAGEAIHAAALAGLLASGCDVVDLGVAMTPTVAVMADALAREAVARGEGATTTTGASTSPRVAAGMVITASHNPQQWNGLKCLRRDEGDPSNPACMGSSACAPPAGIAADIIERFRAGRPGLVPWDGVGTLARAERAGEEHVERVMRALEESGLTDHPATIGKGLRVAVDCVNASASRTAPLLLRSLGCDVVELNTNATGPLAGLFPHPPEPTRENLSAPEGLCDAVRERRCDLGFALDPDADRLALIDERGSYVGEEYTLALGALAILSSAERSSPRSANARVLVTNLSTSRMLDDVAARFGARVLRTPVGEANVVEAMKRVGALAGGEGNGGTIWPRTCYVRDSLAAMALTLWLLSPRGGGNGAMRSLSAVAASIPSYAIEKRKVDLAQKEDASRAVEAIAKHFASQRVDLRDGAWVGFTSGPLASKAWLHVRASNTEPIMRLIAEAPTSAQSNALLDEAARAIRT
jgi:phosphomannomutase